MNDLVMTTPDALVSAKENLEIKMHQIEQLINTVPESIGLKRFETSGTIIPWNDHNVTGREINQQLVSPLQQALEKANKNVRKLYDICTQIYVTIGTLDDEYISGIVGAVNSATVASNQALTAWEGAKLALSQANKAQADIKRTIEVLQAMVAALNRFKEDVKDRIPNEREVEFIHRDIKQLSVNLEIINNFTVSLENKFLTHTKSVKDAVDEQRLSCQKLERKLKISYIIGGIAIALSLAQIIISII